MLPSAAAAAAPRLASTRRSALHAGFLLALVAVVVVYWLLFRTTLGFEFRAERRSIPTRRAMPACAPG